MKRAIDGNNLKLTLDHATDMLKELRSNTLWPKNYYDLYMKVRNLIGHFLNFVFNKNILNKYV